MLKMIFLVRLNDNKKKRWKSPNHGRCRGTHNRKSNSRYEGRNILCHDVVLTQYWKSNQAGELCAVARSIVKMIRYELLLYYGTESVPLSFIICLFLYIYREISFAQWKWNINFGVLYARYCRVRERYIGLSVQSIVISQR